MRSLITGVGGFAGQHLAELLMSRDCARVSGLERHPVSWHRGDLCEESGFALLTADLTKAEEVARALHVAEPEWVFLLAAHSAPGESFADPMGTIVNNVACVLNVLEAIRLSGAPTRILLVSSGEIYGRPQDGASPHTELAPLAPDNPYAVSKVAQDLLGRQYHVAYGLDVVRVRPFNHIGPGQSDRFVTAAFARQIAEAESGLRDPVIDVGNLTAQRDFTDVRDIVRGYERALEKGHVGEAYNLASGVARSVQSVLDGLVARSRVAIDVRFDPKRARPVDAPLVVGDATRFRQQCEWAPAIPFEQTLDDILDDWRQRITVV